MVRSSMGDERSLPGDLSEALEDGVVAKESFLQDGNWKHGKLYERKECIHGGREG